MGWLPYALQNNFSVFVVDQAGRARSGFDRSVFHEARVTNNLSLIPTISVASSDTIWNSVLTSLVSTGAFGHLIPAGSTILNGTLIRHGDPGDPDPSSPEPGPAHGSYPPAFPIPPVDSSIDANIQARVGAIGPAPNPVNNTYLALNFNKYLIPNSDDDAPELLLSDLHSDDSPSDRHLDGTRPGGAGRTPRWCNGGGLAAGRGHNA